MKQYLSFLKLRFNVNLQYRFAAIAGLATQFFWGAMLIMIYKAYYNNGVEVDMSWPSLVTYIWLGQALRMLIEFSFSDSDIRDSILSGQVSYELVRPTNIYWLWFIKTAAARLTAALLRFFPILLIAFILPTEYRMGLPSSFLNFILFIITLTCGFLLSTRFYNDIIRNNVFYQITQRIILYIWNNSRFLFGREYTNTFNA